MKITKIFNSQKKEDVNIAAQMIAAGHLVAFPTETVYGLGGNSTQEKTVANIFKAKNRPNNNPLILHVNSLIQALNVFDITQSFNLKLTKNRLLKLAKNFWPGPLTIICYKKKHIPNIVTANLPQVAVRIPDHKIAQDIISIAKVPIAAPSANISARPSSTSASHVLLTLNGKIDAIIDGGSCKFGIESTIINISGPKVKILRLGAIKYKNIEKVLNEKINHLPITKTQKKILSPGMLEKHYSPQIAKIILCKKKELEKAWIKGEAILLKKSSVNFLEKKFGKRTKNHIIEKLPNNAKGFAKELYSSFYRLEQKNIKLLFIEKQDSNIVDSLWNAINDKLTRAAD